MRLNNQLLRGYFICKKCHTSCTPSTARELSPKGGARVEDSRASAPTRKQDSLQVVSLRVHKAVEGGDIV